MEAFLIVVLVVGVYWAVYKFMMLGLQSTVELIPPTFTLVRWFFAPKKKAEKMAAKKVAEWVVEAKEFEGSVREELGSMAEKGGKWASIMKSEAAQQYEAAMKKARAAEPVIKSRWNDMVNRQKEKENAS